VRSVPALYDAATVRHKGGLGPATHFMLVDICDWHNKIIVMLTGHVAAISGSICFGYSLQASAAGYLIGPDSTSGPAES
jgi:hypothetical protein